MIAPTQSLIDEIEAFLNSRKKLVEVPPLWGESKFFSNGLPERKAIWPICNDLEIVGKGQFRFAARAGDKRNFSISIIYDQLSIARLDFENDNILKPNPHWAESLGLQASVRGSHIHRWQDNKDFILSTENWDLPCRMQLPPQIRKFDQAFAYFAEYANVEMTVESRRFDLPWEML